MRTPGLIRYAAIAGALATGLMAGCANRHSVYEPPSIEGLRFTAVAQVVGSRKDSVHVRVMAHNPTRHVRVIESGGCPVLGFRAYAETSAAPVWSAEAWQEAVALRPRACVAMLFRTEVPPRDSAPAGLYAAPVRAILGDSLSPGTYRIGATPIGSAWRAGEVPAGTVELQVGLTAPRDVRLPEGYTQGPAVLLPDTLHEVYGGGTFRLRIERAAKNAIERDLIERAERLMPPPAAIDSAIAAETRARRRPPAPVVIERRGPRWWTSEAHRTLIPYALTGDAVAHVVERVRQFSREPLPSYFEPGWDHEVYATYHASVESQPMPHVAYRVHMKLDFFIACGGRCGYGFVPERTVDFDMAGNIVAVTGDGRIVQKYR